MSDIGKAYVQIVPIAEGISGSISSILDKESTSAGKSAGLNIAGAIKGVIAAAGIGTAVKAALEAGGNLQQSFGGLETLYGDAAEAAKAYAAEASKAGISANSYAEQAVSFGASLKQAFGGDTQKAMEAANVAILDMADNSAKMGTDISAVQTAYQGFAKQNYTMLDNLKLGYGGTKTEMERLLADAQKLSGVEYNIDNLGDVYSAIHVIQENLGLTGVAAAEASETFSGSLGAMKAAGENLLANLALGEDIGPSLDALGVTVNSFLFNNLLPMVGNMLEAVPELLSGLSGILIQSLNIVSNNSDEIVAQGLEIVTSLVSAIVEAAPYIAEAAINLAVSLGEALLNTDWIALGTDLISSLRDSIDMAAGEILGADTLTIDSIIDGIMNGLDDLMQSSGEILNAIYEGITTYLPTLLESGVEIISSVAEGILNNLPELITTAGELITDFASFVLDNLPTIISAGAKLLLSLVNGIINNLPQIIASVVQIMAKFTATIGEKLPEILQKGYEIIGQLAVGLIQAIPKLISSIPQILFSIKDAFDDYDWLSIGANILEGIKNGVLGAISSVVDAAIEAGQAIWDAVTGFFDINSPSKKMAWIGKMDMEGLAQGIEDNSDIVDDAFKDITSDMTSKLQVSADFGKSAARNTDQTPLVLNMTINGAEGQDINALADIIQNKINMAVRQRELVYA